MMARQFSSVFSRKRAQVTAVIGAQWGDEGKGRLVDKLASEYDICARYNGGANADHDIFWNGKKFVLHLLPCGMLNEGCQNLIGNGVVVHLPTLFKELTQFDENKIPYKGRLFISNRAHIVTQMHLEADGILDKKAGIGTTRRGIGPTYTTKALRNGLRVGDLTNWQNFEKKYMILYKQMNEMFKLPELDVNKDLSDLKMAREKLLENKMIICGVNYLHNALEIGKRILIEGANSAMLDIDHGSYPYCTSSSTSIGGACTGLGIPPDKIKQRIGVVKCYTTKVGSGPFPTEMEDELAEKIRKVGNEFAVATQRNRRVGWLDLNMLRAAHTINNFTEIMLTKLDILDDLDEIKVAYKYKVNDKKTKILPDMMDGSEKIECKYYKISGWKEKTSGIRKIYKLPKKAIKFIDYIEDEMRIPVKWVGCSPNREEIIRRKFDPWLD